jgi:hypothetical protein
VTASTRSLIWLAAIFVGLLPLAADPGELFMPAPGDRLAAWDETDDDNGIPPDPLSCPDATASFLSLCAIQSGANPPGGRFSPPNGGGIACQSPLVSQPLTRPPPAT